MTQRLVVHALTTLALLVTPVLAGCGESGSEGGSAPSYTSERVAPLPSELSDASSDTTPSPDDALVEIEMDSGGTAAVWIDPQDIRRVYVQASDPADPDAWTEPVLAHEAGDGCLTLDVDTAGETLAIGAGCYADDAFIQQAPESSVALVSTDLVSWESDEVGESIPVPEVVDDGDRVLFRNQVYDDRLDTEWERGEGF
ncbi:hypothetical protein [Nocardioides nanhaiensis]|uniref:Uncharacterized protein n=1 Tax=Nocardioides nanhaiensis TaxID=1476871 RepID=A0ABP8WQC3_9ACTN